jgi:hypothetical protein
LAFINFVFADFTAELFLVSVSDMVFPLHLPTNIIPTEKFFRKKIRTPGRGDPIHQGILLGES